MHTEDDFLDYQFEVISPNKSCENWFDISDHRMSDSYQQKEGLNKAFFKGEYSYSWSNPYFCG